MSKRPCLVCSFGVPITKTQEFPNQEHRAHKHRNPKRVFLDCDPRETGFPCPTVVSPAQVRIILYEQDRQWYKQIRAPCEHGLDGLNGIVLGKHHQYHYDVTKILDPSFEGDKGVIGPKHADGQIEVEQEN